MPASATTPKNPLLALHQEAHHATAHAKHIHLRQLQFQRAGRQHHAEHLAEEVLLHTGFLHFLQDVQSPEGEENGYFLSRCRCSVCQYKGCQRFIQVVTEQNQRLSPTPATGVLETDAQAGAPFSMTTV